MPRRTLRRIARTAALLVAALVLSGLAAAPAAAHGTFKSGALTFEGFGLGNEGVKVNEETWYEFTVTKGGKPVVWTPAQLKQLTVHVFVGDVKPTPELAARQPDGKPLQLAIEAHWEGPGQYRSDAFGFSNPGLYTAHLHSPLEGVAGATETIPVGGQVIDLVAPMGPETYGGNGIVPLKTWPVQQPTTAELANADQTLTADVQAAQATATTAADQAGSPSLLTWGALAAGLVALLVGTIALVAARRRVRVPDSPADLDRAGRP